MEDGQQKNTNYSLRLYHCMERIGKRSKNLLEQGPVAKLGLMLKNISANTLN